MSKTDQMRAVREARFADSNVASPKRPSIERLPFPGAAARMNQRAHSPDVEPIPAPLPSWPVAHAQSFEMPTLDIPLPEPVPRVRGTSATPSRSRASERARAAALQVPLPSLGFPEPTESTEFTTAVGSPGLVDDSRDVHDGSLALATQTSGSTVASPPPFHGVAKGRPISGYGPDELERVILWVTRCTPEGGIDDIVRDVMSELGMSRRGKRVVDMIERSAISLGVVPAPTPADPGPETDPDGGDGGDVH